MTEEYLATGVTMEIPSGFIDHENVMTGQPMDLTVNGNPIKGKATKEKDGMVTIEILEVVKAVKMDYADFRKLSRGDRVFGSTVLYADELQGGGVGMGESPNMMTIVLQDGRVYSHDAWSGNKVTTISGKMK